MARQHIRTALERPPRHQALPEDRGWRLAAVALVFRPGDAVLMIRRAERHGDPWSGQMGFPGGKADPGESALDAARREAWEEVGVDLGEPVGELDPIVTPRAFMGKATLVRPFVFFLDHDPPLTPNLAEVAGTHWFEFDRFRSREGRANFHFPFREEQVELPCVRLDGCMIWGMSLRVIDDLLERIG